MGWVEAEMRCKKHPKHRQTPGVCSYCLREKLIKLSSANNNNGTETEEEGSSYSSSLSSSPYSSGATSSYSSPLHDRFDSLDRISGPGLFMKSRSMVAFVPRMRRRTQVEATDGNGKKKVGFWSKLLRSTGKSTKKMLSHSKTMR
ncbi:hypothetical protein NE237_019370 [Protea cynaroides]|uniref:Uncharacterized protein n=1 Tax=Protea cynaroides TaxID=273540 RepID=A0A9Q0KBW5_9MAGN|nr:hypothetical protein NE237_019370 [Protea cynaroides]